MLICILIHVVTLFAVFFTFLSHLTNLRFLCVVGDAGAEIVYAARYTSSESITTARP